jgi:hypothetical protein
MKAPVTPEAENALTEIARRHGLSLDAVLAMLLAVRAGGGTMAQFSIPELGGSGQWMQGGMTMVGDMFDHALKARVDALCNELSQLLATTTVFSPSVTNSQLGIIAANWWPADLGVPSASGGQNNMRYAVFPSTRRLAIEIDGTTRVFDTGEHQIGGVQQQQGTGYRSVKFTSQFGTFDLTRLAELGAQQQEARASASSGSQYQPGRAPEPAPPPQPSTPAASGDHEAIIAAIESLAGLHQRGILSDEEFAAKKAELLGRL